MICSGSPHRLVTKTLESKSPEFQFSVLSTGLHCLPKVKILQQGKTEIKDRMYLGSKDYIKTKKNERDKLPLKKLGRKTRMTSKMK